jgi:hypothetical protein
MVKPNPRSFRRIADIGEAFLNGRTSVALNSAWLFLRLRDEPRYLSDSRFGDFATAVGNRFVVILIHMLTDCAARHQCCYLRIMPLPPIPQQQPEFDWRPFAFAGGIGFALAFALSIFGALFIH